MGLKEMLIKVKQHYSQLSIKRNKKEKLDRD